MVPVGLGGDVRASGRGWWPLLSTSAMAATDHSYGYALVVLGPEIARSLHIPVSAVAALIMFRGVLFFASGGFVAAGLRRRVVDPQTLTTAAGVARVAALLLTGLVTARWALLSGVVLYGLAGVSTPYSHHELLVATYGTTGAVTSFHRSALRIGNVVMAGTIAPVVLIAPSHWQAVFVVLGLISAIGPAAALSVRTPVSAPRATGRAEADPHETFASWLIRPRLRILLLGFAVGGMFEVPMYVFAFNYLSHRWSVGAPSRAGLAAGFEFLGVALGALAVRTRVHRHRHRIAARLVGVTMVSGAAVLAASVVVRQLSGYVTLFLAAMALFGFMAPLLFAGTLTMLPPARPHFWGPGATAAFVAIAAGASAVLAWVASTYGDQAAAACFAVPAAVVGVMVIAAARTVDAAGVPAWWSRWPIPAPSE